METSEEQLADEVEEAILVAAGRTDIKVVDIKGESRQLDQTFCSEKTLRVIRGHRATVVVFDDQLKDGVIEF